MLKIKVKNYMKEESGFKPPITIKSVVERIHKNEYMLPSIQREFVWKKDQIVRLFDSIMREYPAGTFLFWNVNENSQKEFQFYEFIRKYNKNEHTLNEKANISVEDDIVAILDGQQRFTSFYLGLMGTYTEKVPTKRYENGDKFPEQRLHLNLLAQTEIKQDGVSNEYVFEFLTKQESTEINENTFWFEIGKILNFSEQGKMFDFLDDMEIAERFGKEKSKFARAILIKFWKCIHEDKIIHHYLETSQDLDKVLQIFIRVNSGGTQLGHSALLLSIASAQWKNRDARDEINDLVKEINTGGKETFDFDKDFILKSALVLSDISEIGFKVANFNVENMTKIEKNWDVMKESIRIAVSLVESFGYNSKRLTSNNTIIPIAYYLMKNNNPRNFVYNSKFKDERKKIRSWLSASLIKKVFGGTPDEILKPIRDILKNNFKEFPHEEIINKFRGKSKTLIFSEDDLEEILENEYGTKYTFSILAMLYPTLDFKNNFHEDHIFPKSKMSQRESKKYGIKDKDVLFYSQNKNKISNLQLIEGQENEEKSSTLFKKWLDEKPIDEKKEFMKKNYIPENISLEHDNFIEFYNQRKELLKEYFREILEIS
jgi:uncharacterized protein with ParB-like and HNH nuclease domain